MSLLYKDLGLWYRIKYTESYKIVIYLHAFNFFLFSYMDSSASCRSFSRSLWLSAVQAIDKIDKFSFCISFGSIQVSGRIQASDFIQAGLKFFVSHFSVLAYLYFLL